MGVQSDSQTSGQGTVMFGSRCSVGSVEAHAVSQLGRRFRMCGSVRCCVMFGMVRWARLVMVLDGRAVVHPSELGNVVVTGPAM